MEKKFIPPGSLTEYFIRENGVDISKKYEIGRVPARSLICANRFDLMAKWTYIDARERGISLDFATRVYKDNINAFSCGSFIEPGVKDKDSFQKYLDTFNNLIDDIKGEGFNENKSIIPVGMNGSIFDGSHRVAIAAYFDKEVTIVRFSEKNPANDYDYRYFRKYLMSDANMGLMARYYVSVKKSCYFACIWPAANRSKIGEAEAIIEKLGSIVYSQDVYLTYEGMRNFMVRIYNAQSWIGSIEDNYSGVNYKVNPCYDVKNPVKTYLFEADDLESVIRSKAQIRDIFGIENHSIHISDNSDEAIEMAEMLYNSNTVNFLNYGRPFKYDIMQNGLRELRQYILANRLDVNRFIVGSDSVLEVFGVKRVGKVEFLTDYEEGEKCHRKGMEYYDISVEDMLYNSENYFWYNGFKFLSLDRLIEMKKRRCTSDDKKDVKICRRLTKGFQEIPREYRRDVEDKIRDYQIRKGDYGHGLLKYREYRVSQFKDKIKAIVTVPLRAKNFLRRKYIQGLRTRWLKGQRKRLINKDMSVISSNCNGGVLVSDLGLQFNSPFVNLFIKASDFIKLMKDLRGYMDEELVFTDEEDPIYGCVDYPTAFLKDVKIYFMHYDSKEEARNAWNRRRERINWDNIFVIFTDRSQCSQADLEDFDKLPYPNKVVFTHVPHPEIKSSVYIKGYEKDTKVPILTAFKNPQKPIKRIYDQFDFVRWFNGERQTEKRKNYN